MSISEGNSKLGKIPNVSLVPIADCGNCSQCSRKCYALKAYRMYKTTRQSWDMNSHLAHTEPETYFSMIDQYLAKKEPTLFRWHVAGDILDQNYVDQMVELAQKYPQTKFLAFTKMHELDYSAAPSNLSIVASRWPGDSLQPTTDLRQAWMQDGTETRVPENTLECSGSCSTCNACWDLKALNKDVLFNIH